MEVDATAHPLALRGVKIVCTLGPASSELETLRALVLAGMNVARLNFSHGTREEHRRRARLLRQVSAELERPVAILQDLKGPKVRVGEMAAGSVLATGERFELLPGRGTGDRTRAYLDDPLFFEEVQSGDRLLLADGAIELLVREATASRVACEVLAGGPLSSGKGVNVPRGLLRRPILAPEDLEDLAFGVEIGVDLVGISYVRTPEDLRTVRRALRRLDASSPLVAKLETAEAVRQLDAILEATDAVMLARGDLALETPFERLPLEQKRILQAARRRGRPVITATQMLASMVTEARPTRAEVNDVANAVLDGTDAVMLSEETAVGAHPVRAVETMATIAAATERALPGEIRGPEGLPADLRDLAVMAESAARAARAIGTRALVVWTRGGLGARLLSRASPGLPILAPTESIATARLLALVRDVVPLPARDSQVEPERVRAALGARAGEDGPLLVVGHERGEDGRPQAWMRMSRLSEPAEWSRDRSRSAGAAPKGSWQGV
jgi:pyruvate kinase